MSSATKRQPMPSSQGVLTVRGSSVINAPRDKVWGIMTDLQSFGEWNPFATSQRVTDASKTPLPDSAFATGLFLDTEVRLPLNAKSPTRLFDKIIAFDKDASEYRMACSYYARFVPKWLGYTEQWQILTEIDTESGKQTKYEVVEVMSGGLGYLMKWMYERDLNEGFQATANALKARAES